MELKLIIDLILSYMLNYYLFIVLRSYKSRSVLVEWLKCIASFEEIVCGLILIFELKFKLPIAYLALIVS